MRLKVWQTTVVHVEILQDVQFEVRLMRILI
jgi:hypothetical protein